MLQEEPIKLEELKSVIHQLRHMPSPKRISVLMGVLAVQLLVDSRENFDTIDFERVFDRIARSIGDVKQDLMK